MGNVLPKKKHLLKLKFSNKLRANQRSLNIESESYSRKSNPNPNNGWFRYEQGRRFHNFESEEAKYCLPNDIGEQDRLQLQHYLMRFAWKGNFSSPVADKLNRYLSSEEEAFRVLDVGCGPGTWILEMAADYPDAYFYGIDMSAIFPTEIHPKNAEFRQINVLKGLPWPDEYFDFVYQRFMVMSFTVEQWDFVLKELLRVTKKGGWLELFEASTYMGPGPTSCQKLSDALYELSEKRGINSRILPELPNLLRTQGQIEKVYVERIDIPIGPWGGRIGKLCGDDMAQVFENTKIPISKYMEITHEEYDEIRNNVIQEFDIARHSMLTGRIYGRKKLAMSNL